MEGNENNARLERQKIFGENLERIRKEKNFSRKQLAEAIGINETSLGAYVAGRRSPTLDKIYGLANTLKVPISALLGEVADAKEKIQEKAQFEYRLQRALDLIRATGCFPSVESNHVIVITDLDKVWREGDTVVFAPSNKGIVQFLVVESFVRFVETCEIEAAQEGLNLRERFLGKIEEAGVVQKQ